MARTKRSRVNRRSSFQKTKKSRLSDDTSDDDAMDLNQNVIEKPGQSDADLMHDSNDGSGEAQQKEEKNDNEDDSDENSNSSSSDEDSNVG
eukprot:8718584-Ditylum_brightwellii.AAC.1